MAWIKVDPGLPDHPKLAACGHLAPLAGWLYVAALAYAGRYLTDGEIPAAVVARLVPLEGIAVDGAPVAAADLAAALVAAGLWVAVPAGFRIHDYLEHQTARAAVQAKRATAKARYTARRSDSADILPAESRQNSGRLPAESRKSAVPEDRSTEVQITLPKDPGVCVPAGRPATDTRGRPASLIARRRPWAAFEWRLDVPAALHREFLDRLVGPEPERERALRAWYGSVADAWDGRELGGGDGFAWWRARFTEWQGRPRADPGVSSRAAISAFLAGDGGT